MKIILLALLVMILLVITVGYAIFYLAFCRFPRDPKMRHLKVMRPYAQHIDAGMAWFREQPSEEVAITAWDGTYLVGHYLHHPESRGTILMMHGFRSHPYYDFSCAFQAYYELGYSLLTVHQRAHGRSGGQYITFGIKERKDCRNWAQYIWDRYGPEHDIFLDGISMGGATVVMATGLKLPKSVRGVISDCGFISPWEQMKFVLKDYHLPVHPLLDIADLFCRTFAGFSIKEYSTLEAMKVNTLPMLFLHGEADKRVPCRFTLQTYEACQTPKELITVANAGHGLSYLLETERCKEALARFLNTNGRTAKAEPTDELAELKNE